MINTAGVCVRCGHAFEEHEQRGVHHPCNHKDLNTNCVCYGYQEGDWCGTRRLAERDMCGCGSGLPSRWEFDGNGIALCRACPKCRAKKLSAYRPEILRPYTQADVDEPIEPEE